MAWKHLSEATHATLDELQRLGLPVTARQEAWEILWKLAAWQGDREYQNGKNSK